MYKQLVLNCKDGEALIIADKMNRHVGESTNSFLQTHGSKGYQNLN